MKEYSYKIFLIIFFLGFSIAGNTQISKEKFNQIRPFLSTQLTSLSEQYEYGESQNFIWALSFYCQASDSLEKLRCLSTCFHEHHHGVNGNINLQQKLSGKDSVYCYFIDDSSVCAPRIKVENSLKTIPKSTDLGFMINSRAKTYVGKYEEHMVSQKDGFYGLLEEFVAYRTSLDVKLSLYGYLTSKYDSTNYSLWMNYLGDNYVDSYYEFNMMFAWYLNYVKKEKPQMYSKIIQNKRLIELYQYVDSDFHKKVRQYENMQKKIVSTLKRLGVVQHGSIYFKNNMNVGYDIPGKSMGKLKKYFQEDKTMKILNDIGTTVFTD